MRPHLPRTLGLFASGPVMLMLLGSPAAALERWVSLGPNGGSIVALAVGGNGTLLALSANAGPYVSHDGGSHWHGTTAGPPGSEQFPHPHVSASGVLYATDAGGALWRSRDDGATWQSLRAATDAAGAEPALVDLHSAESAPAELVAVFASSAGVPGRPFRSHDGGDTWERLEGFPITAAPQLLRFDPRSRHRLFAATPTGVLWSDDDGDNWHTSDLHLPVLQMDVERGFRGRVYALMLHADPRLPRATVYVSLDHGRTFLPRAQLGAVNRLAVDPSTSGAVFVVDVFGGVYRSTNAGRSFLPRSRLGRSPVLGFVVARNGTAHIAVPGAPFGRSILRSRDHGATWTSTVAGIRAAEVLALAPSADGSRWWTGLGSVAGSVWSASHFGVWALDGAMWRFSGLRGTSVRALSPHPVLPNEVVAATLGAGIGRSLDGGATWSTVSPTGIFVTAVDRDPTEPRHLLAVADRGVAVSTDGGGHWSALADVSTGPHLRFARDGSAFYASLAPGEFFSVDDVDALARFALDGQGKTNLLTLDGRIQDILEPADAGQGLWVASTRYDGTGFGGAVDHSTDGGLHWQRHTLPGDAAALTLAVEPGAHGRVLVGSAGGVYVSSADGASWVPFGTGFPAGLWVSTLVLGQDGRWRAGTRGGGVFVLTEE